MAIGGRARCTLASFWERVADVAGWSLLQPSWYDRLARNWGLEWSPAFLGFDMVTRLLSPYEVNLFNLNPLRDTLAASVDFVELQKPTTGSPVPRGHQRSDRKDQDIPGGGDLRRCGAGLRLPAVPVPGS
jgi:hypothetical protein